MPLDVIIEVWVAELVTSIELVSPEPLAPPLKGANVPGPAWNWLYNVEELTSPLALTLRLSFNNTN
jgi:hypothetical protein